MDTAGLRYVNPQWVDAGLRLGKDQPVDIEDITRKIDVLYGTDDFERISYGFEYENGERVLVVQPVELALGFLVVARGGLQALDLALDVLQFPLCFGGWIHFGYGGGSQTQSIMRTLPRPHSCSTRAMNARSGWTL